MNEDQFSKIHELGIPVEVCPSSNKATMNLSVMSQLKSIPNLYKLGATIIPCCDDTMLFNTNMINELFELVNLLQLNQLDIKEMYLKSIDAIFDDGCKEAIREEILKYKVKGEEAKESDQSDNPQNNDQTEDIEVNANQV